MINECVFKTPLANISIKEQNDYIIGVEFTKRKLKKTSNKVLLNAKKQINQYFKGRRKSFTVKINPMGTVFQQKVWNKLKLIKYGEKKFYSDIAKELKSSPRAIGNACGKNKCLIIIPCHRIVSKNIKKTNSYSSFGGMVHKNILLSFEKNIVNN
tara:strand:- start:25 stop:489 length:465 start_codon:yes stop_codon:yes gene_type:complete